MDVLVEHIDERGDRGADDQQLRRILTPVEREELCRAEVRDDVDDEQAEHADRSHVEENVRRGCVVDTQRDEDRDRDRHHHSQGIRRRAGAA